MEAYERLSSVYDRWITGDPAREACHAFYPAYCRTRSGAAVELGVGSGEIAVAAAALGCTVVGVDSSAAMLEACARKAHAKGVLGRVLLLQADMTRVHLRGVSTMMLPFRTIGHLLTPALRRRLFANVSAALAPGGQFVLDHYIPDLDWARSVHGRALEMYEDSEGADPVRISDCYEFDFRRERMRCRVSVTPLADQSTCPRQEIEFDFAWVRPEEIESHARAVGLEVESLFGDFAGGPFQAGSSEQVWILRRPD